MIVILLEKVSPSLRGELSRWLLEPKTGVFVGQVSPVVRDKLWQKCADAIGSASGGLLIHRDDNEQGFTLRTAGVPSREIVDYEGLLLVRVPHGDPEKAKRKMRLGRKKDAPRTEELSFASDGAAGASCGDGDCGGIRSGATVESKTASLEADDIGDDDEYLDVPLWWGLRKKSEPPAI